MEKRRPREALLEHRKYNALFRSYIETSLETFQIQKPEIEIARDRLPEKLRNSAKLDMLCCMTGADMQLFEMRG